MIRDLKDQIKADPDNSEDKRIIYHNALSEKDRLKAQKKEIKAYIKHQRAQQMI